MNHIILILSYGQLPHEPLWGRIMIKFSHLLLTLSSAVNILIYSYKVIIITLSSAVIIIIIIIIIIITLSSAVNILIYL